MLTNSDFEIKRCLVTGGAGFIGFHVSRKLMLEGVQILVVDNLNEYYDPKLKESRINNLNELSKDEKLNRNSYDFMNVDLTDESKVFQIINSLIFEFYIIKIVYIIYRYDSMIIFQ